MSASAQVKTVTVQMDRERHMRLTLADAREFRKLTTTDDRPGGISLLRGDLARWLIAEEEWIQLFYVMLRHEDPELTPDQVAELMDMERFVACGEAFEDLFSSFKPKEGEAPQADPTASPGATS